MEDRERQAAEAETPSKGKRVILHVSESFYSGVVAYRKEYSKRSTSRATNPFVLNQIFDQDDFYADYSQVDQVPTFDESEISHLRGTNNIVFVPPSELSDAIDEFKSAYNDTHKSVSKQTIILHYLNTDKLGDLFDAIKEQPILSRGKYQKYYRCTVDAITDGRNFRGYVGRITGKEDKDGCVTWTPAIALDKKILVKKSKLIKTNGK